LVAAFFADMNGNLANLDKAKKTVVIADELAKHVAPVTCVYFCMESDNIWQEVFGYTPE
jgi:hypothetical protein